MHLRTAIAEKCDKPGPSSVKHALAIDAVVLETLVAGNFVICSCCAGLEPHDGSGTTTGGSGRPGSLVSIATSDHKADGYDRRATSVTHPPASLSNVLP